MLVFTILKFQEMTYEEIMKKREALEKRRREIDEEMWPLYEADYLSLEEKERFEKLSREYGILNEEDTRLVKGLIETFKKN
ncbi:hypothetical protein SDC9_07774 [bioreactor metagenome]|uniref:Uncharacterized protein n=1 Tax=bioreactor metagenome TaxID=1076179 RepID=A0A644T5P9_9ZZZZ